MFKTAILMKRRAGIGVEDFQRHLRGDYAALLAKAPALRRCVLSCALIQGYGKGELVFDAVGEMWFDGPDDFDRAMRSPQFAAARDDEAQFLDRSGMVTMPVDVHVIKDGAIPAGAVKNIEFVSRRPGMALAPFQAYWREVHGPLAAKIAAIRRYEQNHLAARGYRDHAPPRYDGLAITWFASTADMRTGATTAEYAATRADEANFLPDGHLPIIITREHVVV